MNIELSSSLEDFRNSMKELPTRDDLLAIFDRISSVEESLKGFNKFATRDELYTIFDKLINLETEVVVTKNMLKDHSDELLNLIELAYEVEKNIESVTDEVNKIKEGEDRDRIEEIKETNDEILELLKELREKAVTEERIKKIIDEEDALKNSKRKRGSGDEEPSLKEKEISGISISRISEAFGVKSSMHELLKGTFGPLGLLLSAGIKGIRTAKGSPVAKKQVEVLSKIEEKMLRDEQYRFTQKAVTEENKSGSMLPLLGALRNIPQMLKGLASSIVSGVGRALKGPLGLISAGITTAIIEIKERNRRELEDLKEFDDLSEYDEEDLELAKKYSSSMPTFYRRTKIPENIPITTSSKRRVTHSGHTIPVPGWWNTRKAKGWTEEERLKRLFLWLKDEGLTMKKWTDMFAETSDAETGEYLYKSAMEERMRNLIEAGKVTGIPIMADDGFYLKDPNVLTERETFMEEQGKNIRDRFMDEVYTMKAKVDQYITGFKTAHVGGLFNPFMFRVGLDASDPKRVGALKQGNYIFNQEYPGQFQKMPGGVGLENFDENYQADNWQTQSIKKGLDFVGIEPNQPLRKISTKKGEFDPKTGMIINQNNTTNIYEVTGEQLTE